MQATPASRARLWDPKTWQQGLSTSGSQLIQNTQTGQSHSLNSHDQFFFFFFFFFFLGGTAIHYIVETHM